MHNIEDIAKSKSARFTLTGVIASKDPASAKRTHDTLQKICTCIIEAYRVANDGMRSSSEKRSAILSITKLEPEINWLVEFTRQETDFCKFYPEIYHKLVELSSAIEREVNLLLGDFENLQNDIDSFPDVFGNMLHLLEKMTHFMKQCHGAEVCRCIEMGKNAQNEVYNLLFLEVKPNFVPQVELAVSRSKQFETATSNLVKIQEGQNEDLEVRLDSALALMKSAMPAFILASKEHLLTSTPPLKEAQKHAYDDVLACLEELEKICERIKVKYIHAFDEELHKGPAVTPLHKAAQDVMQAVSKLRAAPADIPDADRKILQEGIPRTTRAALAQLDDLGAEPAEKQKLVQCVKQARDGPLSEYYQAQDALGALVDRVQANSVPFIPTLTLSMPAETIEESPMDLLEAAKQLCASMKTLNITLDD